MLLSSFIYVSACNYLYFDFFLFAYVVILFLLLFCLSVSTSMCLCKGAIFYHLKLSCCLFDYLCTKYFDFRWFSFAFCGSWYILVVLLETVCLPYVGQELPKFCLFVLVEEPALTVLRVSCQQSCFHSYRVISIWNLLLCNMVICVISTKP